MKKLMPKNQQVQVEVDPKTHVKYLKIRLTDSLRRQLAPMKGKPRGKKA
ncbi:MAG: hypothetical protein LAP86_19540 [Acidobacteriia bacterium]|nr:hypothetical protein [Terriglobia bacterium]